MNDTLEIIARQDGTVEITAGIQGDANIEAKVEQPAEIAVEIIAAGPRGPQGPAGADGQDGQGVPDGGSTGDFLRKHSDDDYDTEWDEFPSIAKGTDTNGYAVIIGRLDDQTASGNYSMAVGRENVVSAGGDVALGRNNNISASFSFAAGYGNVVQKVQNSNAQCAAAIGDGNTVDGYTAFAEGYHNQALKQCAHAEGQSTIASGFQAHSEGFTTTASGYNSHAENDRTIASGADSHAEGLGTIANHQCQHVFGRRNIPDPSVEASTTYGNYVEIVGNGQSENELSNARTLDWDGNEVLAGKLTLGAGPTGNMDAATKKYVDDNIPAVPEAATNAPEDLGTAAVGSSAKYALEDHVHNKPTYSASDVGLGNVDNVQQYSASNPPPYPVTSVNGNTGAVTVSVPTKVSDLSNDSGFVDAAGAAAAAPVTSVNGQTGAVSLTIPTVPTDVSAFNNDAGYITTVTSTDVTSALGYTPYSDANPSGFVDSAGAASAAPVQSVNGNTGAVTLSIPSTASDVGALPDTTKYALSASVGGSASMSEAIPWGKVDNTSTSTAFTATVSGITKLADGTSFWLKNGVITSASGFTVNVNNLGAKKCYNNMTAATQDTTIFNINYTMLFVYDSSLDSGAGGYYIYRGYDANTNTIGYQIRTNSFSVPMTSITYRYRLLFQSADKKCWVPANNSTSTNATAARSVCQDPINPFGPIVYYGTTASVAAGSRPSAAYLWQEYTLTLGYSFQQSPNYELTAWKPVYLKCAPQSDGSAIIDSTTPFTQDLPTTEDGKLYILLGFAYSTTSIELVYYHPVYWYKGGRIRPFTDAATPTPAEIGAIALPAAPSAGDFLVYNGSSWAAVTMAEWQGGNY